MAQYTAVFTTYGTQLLAKAIANNKPLTVTHFAVGDGNGNAVTVNASQERLVNEKYRATISAVSLDPRNNKQVIFELTIPEDIGGFYIREMGVFDANNKLVAYANCPESFKPTLASGSGKVQVMRMILLVASSNAVTLTVDDSVIFVTRGQLTPQTITANSANGVDQYGHSHAIDKASTTKPGIVQLTNDTGLDSENLGLTAKAGKVLAQGIAALRLALNNYIPNSKKSNAVNSNSNDTVATSAAVKSANDNANARVAKSGDTMTGNLSFKQGDYSGISLYNNNEYYLRLEGNNHDNGTMLTAVYRKPNGENVAVAFLPKRDGTIAYVDDVVRKTGDTMTGTLSINKSTERYPIGSYTWGVPLSLSGDAMISNGVTGIAFNNNGALHLGGRKNSHEFIATIDSEGIYTGGVMRATGHTAKAYGQGTFANQWDDKKAPYVVHNPNANGQNIYYPFIKGLNTNGSDYGTAFSLGYMTPGTINQFGRGVIHLIEDNGTEKMWWFGHDGTLQGADFATNDGKRLTKTHQTNYAYVETTASNNVWGGLRINRNGEFMLVESNSLGGFDFIRRNKDGSNVYALSTPTKNGTLATLEDFGGKLSGNGWTRLPNGLILQWGTANGGWVNFPIAFPNACFSVVGTQGQGSDYEPYVIYNISNTRFYHKGKVEHEANGAHWMAIGN